MSNTRVWSNYVLESRVEYGSAARGNRGYYSGTKIHKLHCEYIVGVVDEAAEQALPYRTLGKRFLLHRKPVLFCCYPACGCTRGQNAGAPLETRGPADVTCEKCKGYTQANKEEQSHEHGI